MAQASTPVTTRYAVVTGANKGIGFEICKQLASNGVVVVLTARDESKGLEAINNLKKHSGLSDHLLFFHRHDVLDLSSIASLADFVKTHFGKLDILVNNAGVGGVELDHGMFKRATELCGGWPDGKQVKWHEISSQKFDAADTCLKTNYYGAKAMVEALAPLLHLSQSPRIINVSSFLGHLANIPNEWAKRVLSDAESLTEERVDKVVSEFMRDFEDNLLAKKGWPVHVSAYIVAKAALNAYTRIAAKKYPSFYVNCVCPGFCRTDITTNLGTLSAAQGAETITRLALLPEGELTSGCFFRENRVVDF